MDRSHFQGKLYAEVPEEATTLPRLHEPEKELEVRVRAIVNAVRTRMISPDEAVAVLVELVTNG